MKPGSLSPTTDEMVSDLVREAHEAADQPLTAREQTGLRRLERALAHQVRPRRDPRSKVRWLLFAALLGVAMTALALRERALTFEVEGGKISEGGYIASGADAASVHFSDRSDLVVAPETRLRVSHLGVHGANVMLEGGTLGVHINPRPKATWSIDAGPYIVHVTGTEFDLAWRADEQTLDLRMHKGSVIVEGPLASGGLRMEAGQHLVANANDGSLSIVDEQTARVAPSASGPAPVPAPLTPALPAGAIANAPLAAPGSRGGLGASPVVAARPEVSNWTARVARGEFGAIIEDAERRGIEKSLAVSSPVELGALADAARYARRADIAALALLAERTRFPTSVQAHDAAFFLGGVAEVQKDDSAAFDWYDVYLHESQAGAFAPQALGRKMIMAQKLRGLEAAKPMATDYLERFPTGPYAPSARKLLQVQ